MDLEELYSFVEDENWLYKGKPSRTCSPFVVDVLKAGGLFGNLKIHSTEFTPKDVLEVNFWNNKYQYGKLCEGFVVDGYCQIMGNIVLETGKTSFVEPYDHMNERCES